MKNKEVLQFVKLIRPTFLSSALFSNVLEINRHPPPPHPEGGRGLNRRFTVAMVVKSKEL